ncbi:MAG: hypothetical protein ACD_19C00410G0007 [uncultured bacterium]|nr:MAG: hypothetical protein ACD_19C00410G0007 [uncultured bacterium]
MSSKINMPKCIYRIPAKEGYQSQDMRLELAVLQSLPKCRVLVDKGVADTDCQNSDCSESTCPISPINQEKK